MTALDKELQKIWNNPIVTDKGEWTINKYDCDSLKNQFGVKNLKPNKNNTYFMIWHLDYSIGCWAFCSKHIFNSYKQAINFVNKEIA